MEATLTLLKRLEITDNYNYEKFQTLIEQKLTEKTKSTYYPRYEADSHGQNEGLKYVHKS